MGSKQRSLESLRVHLINIQTATSFEEFKKVQVAYVEYLVASYEAEIQASRALEDYGDRSVAFVTRTEWRSVEKTDESQPK